jgi:hypothetical protein
MNERIQQLKGKIWTEEYWTNPNTDKLLPAQLNRFAELIVRECISKIESKRSSGENNDQWTFTRDLCYHNMILDLKEHFGVEE